MQEFQSKAENSQAENYKKIIRGGQVFLHNLRMITQVLKKVLLWTLPLALLFSMGIFLKTTDRYDRYLGEQWISAQFNAFVYDDKQTQKIIDPSGNELEAQANQVINSAEINKAVKKLTFQMLKSFLAGLIIYGISIFLTLWWLKTRGQENSRSKYIKGDYLSDVKTVKKIMLKEKKLSSRIFGVQKLPLPEFSEMQHIALHGTTGSGKTTGIAEFMDSILEKGERAIVYCKGGSYVKKFFRPNHDKLLNPLDKRGESWNLWAECRDKADFENLAAALIPMTPHAQDPFWVNAARTILSVAAYNMSKDDSLNEKQKYPKVTDLLKTLLTANVESLQMLLEGTEAETLMSEKTEKTAISIKSVLATYLKSLCYIKDEENPFSIRQWINNDELNANAPWLFISSLGDKHESLKPLITAWLDIAVNALLSLPENPNRRIWVILDEVTSLQQLPYLTSALSESRKFGGCFVIGLQSYAQLCKTYGNEGAKEISSLLNTRFMFRIPDPDIAQWTAKNLGEMTIEEAREGISYGANTMRDGVSVNRVEREKLVVNASEIMRLPDLNCYVRLPGAYPIVQLNFPYKNRPDKNLPFEARKFDENEIKLASEVDNLSNQRTRSVDQIFSDQATESKTESEKNDNHKKTKKEKKSEKESVKTNIFGEEIGA